MNEYYVYTHSINGKVFYVGSNYMAANPSRAYEIKGRPEKWHEIVNKNNGEYDIEIVERFETSKEANKKEIELIYYYHDIGLAEASGEDRRGRNFLTGNKHSEETKKKIGLQSKKRRGHTCKIARLMFAKLPTGDIIKAYGFNEMHDKLIELNYNVPANSINQAATLEIIHKKSNIKFWRES